MMKMVFAQVRNAVLLSAFALVLPVSCANLSKPDGPSEASPARGPRFVLDLQPGPEYHKPQVAAWVSTPEGGFLETLYVTAKGGRGRWIFAPRSGRPEALPVWSGARAEGAEVVASATPAGALTHSAEADARFPPGTYVVWLEVNRSFDYNELYPKGSGVGGQPSVVYSAEVQVGAEACEAVFRPVGTGSVDGTDGEIRPGLDSITTALEIFSSLKVAYRPY